MDKSSPRPKLPQMWGNFGQAIFQPWGSLEMLFSFFFHFKSVKGDPDVLITGIYKYIWFCWKAVSSPTKLPQMRGNFGQAIFQP